MQDANIERENLKARRAEVIRMLEAEWVASKSEQQNVTLKQLKRQSSSAKVLATKAVDVVGKLSAVVTEQDATVKSVVAHGEKLSAFASGSAGPMPKTLEQKEKDHEEKKKQKEYWPLVSNPPR